MLSFFLVHIISKQTIKTETECLNPYTITKQINIEYQYYRRIIPLNQRGTHVRKSEHNKVQIKGNKNHTETCLRAKLSLQAHTKK